MDNKDLPEIAGPPSPDLPDIPLLPEGDKPATELARVPQRIVLEHTQGICKGLFGIYGTTDQLKADLNVSELPDFLPDVDMRDHINAVCLVRVTPRYVLYREITPPPASGQLGEFHPRFNPEQQ